jgi:hypothetical protein
LGDPQWDLTIMFWQFYLFSISQEGQQLCKKVQSISILMHTIITCESFLKLTLLSSFPSLSFFDMLLVTCEGFGTNFVFLPP